MIFSPVLLIIIYISYLSIALHGRCSVNGVTVQAVTWHLVSYHTCDDHPRVDPCGRGKKRSVH